MPAVMLNTLLILAFHPCSLGAIAYAGPEYSLSAIPQTIGLMTIFVGLTMIAAALIAALSASRRKYRAVAKLAQHRSVRMQNILATAKMAEAIAGIGVWECNLENGEQHWSDGMRRIFGIEGDGPMVEGDAETLLFANSVNLVEAVRDRSNVVQPYDLSYEMCGFDGHLRTIHVRACNQRAVGGASQRVVAVVRDVTESVERERKLENSREAAEREASVARRLAETDALTGLANRRSVMDGLDRIIMDARRSSTPLVLVVFDIDRFKAVNDTYGHIEGDGVLRRVADIAQSQSRTRDIIGRVGGEEFVWVIQGAGDKLAQVLTERLRAAVALGSATDVVPAVTISAGIAELVPGDTSLSLFARADSALYEAKNAGRNRVRLAA